MDLEIKIMPNNFRFNEETWYTHEESKMPTKNPLICVAWERINGAWIQQFTTIEMIFEPIEEYVTIPEEVRLEVIRKYEDKLKPYLQ